jgi:hypothetical protein
VLALWVPGDTPVALPAGTAFDVPADAELVVRARYKKTWEYEREAVTDSSEVGLYFSADRPQALRAMTFSVPRGEQPEKGVAKGFVAGTTLAEGIRVLSIYPAASSAGARITVEAIPPEGLLQRLIEFSPRAGWERRYAFDTPVDLPRGTQVSVSASWDGESAARPADGGALLVLNLVPLPPR